MAAGRRQQAPYALVVAVVLIVLFGWLGWLELARDFRRNLGASLGSVLGASHEAARAWVERELVQVRLWANDPVMRDAARRLLQRQGSGEALRDAPDRLALVRWLDSVIDSRGFDGFELVARDGSTLASSDPNAVGRPSTVPFPATLLDSLWAGQPLVLPPRPRRNGPAAAYDPHLFVAAPVPGPDGHALAVFVVQLDPEGEFSGIFERGRFGTSGETFAYDASGQLLSVARGASAGAHFEPGPESHATEEQHERATGRPMTHDSNQVRVMTHRRSGISLGGYTAYRGAEVVGAWRWDDTLGFGIATELDHREAFGPLVFTGRVLFGLTFVSTLLVVGAVVFRQRSRQLEALIDGAPLGMMLVDAKGGILRVNPAARNLFGYENDELNGVSVERLVPESLRGAHVAHRHDYQHAPRTRFMDAGLHLRGLRRDGSLVPLEVALAPIEVDGRPLVFAMLWDIGPRLTTERELRERTEDLARSNRDLEQFAYVASHDLRAPLRGIAQLTEWLSADLAPHASEDSKQHLDLVLNRVRRMDQLLNSLLEYARASRGNATEERVDVQRLVHDVADLLAWPSGFVLKVPEPLPTVQTDASALQQVLHNLIGNAIKHHDRAQGTIAVRAERTREGLEFLVTDDGPGIPPHLRQKAFEMFQTLRPRDEVEGSGMGLALVQRIIERRGGRVSIEAAEPRGTAVRFLWSDRTGRGMGGRA